VVGFFFFGSIPFITLGSFGLVVGMGVRFVAGVVVGIPTVARLLLSLLVIVGDAAVDFGVGLRTVAAEFGAVAVGVQRLVTYFGFEDEGVVDEFVS